jgi:hypothetical protein
MKQVTIEEDNGGIWILVKEKGNVITSFAVEKDELEPILIAIEDYLEKA